MLCPHPDARKLQTLEIDGGKGPMHVCRECADLFRGLIRGWHSRQLGPKEVVSAMRGMGYTRRDAAQFVLQLSADRLRVRLGFADEADLVG